MTKGVNYNKIVIVSSDRGIYMKRIALVRIKIQRESKKRGSSKRGEFLFPVGKFNQITIYPMTFDEYK